jgi:hypothetical protein
MMLAPDSHPSIALPRAGYGLSPQTLRENEALELRIRKCAGLYQQVNELLQGQAGKNRGRLTREALFSLAEQMISALGTPRIDRLATRKKEGLMCWFCENINDLVKILHMGGATVPQTPLSLPQFPRASEPSHDEPEPPAPLPDFPPAALTWGTVTTYDFFDWSRW